MTLEIPTDLLPADGRFGSGPSKVPASALQWFGTDAATRVMGTSHRQAPVKDLVARAKAGIASLLHLPDGYEVVLGNGGSTAFWDAAVCNLVMSKAQAVVCGEFSSKLAGALTAAPFLAEPSVIRAEPGTGAVCNAELDVDTYCWPQNETSTGVVLPVSRAGLPVEAITLVDATSAAGALDVDVSAADVYYFAPQKVLASDGGLWLAAFSPAAVERVAAVRARTDRWLPASLDLGIAIENSRKDQTYNTPAIATIWLLVAQLEAMLEAGGLAAAAARCNDSSDRLYAWAERSEHWAPFVADPLWRSPVVGTIDAAGGVDAAAVAAVLRANGVVDTEPYRGLGRNQLRVGMYPAVDPDDVSALTACIDWVTERL